MSEKQNRFPSKVTYRGDTHLPEPIREYLRVGEGDYLVWTVQGDNYVLVRKGELREVL